MANQSKQTPIKRFFKYKKQNYTNGKPQQFPSPSAYKRYSPYVKECDYDCYVDNKRSDVKGFLYPDGRDRQAEKTVRPRLRNRNGTIGGYYTGNTLVHCTDIDQGTAPEERLNETIRVKHICFNIGFERPVAGTNRVYKIRFLILQARQSGLDGLDLPNDVNVTVDTGLWRVIYDKILWANRQWSRITDSTKGSIKMNEIVEFIPATGFAKNGIYIGIVQNYSGDERVNMFGYWKISYESVG